MTIVKKLVEMRRWLASNDTPTGIYYFELYTGERGEADSPLCIFDLIINKDYSDCDDRKTQIIMLGLFLRDVAAKHLASQGIRATVYDGVGPFFDNAMSRYPDDLEELGEVEFSNQDKPIILDFWDEWTVISSLIKCGYLKLFEKAPTFSATHQENNCRTCYYYNEKLDHCTAWQATAVAGRMESTCPFWTIPSSRGEYEEVLEDRYKEEPLWKLNYRPIKERTIEYDGLKLQL